MMFEVGGFFRLEPGRQHPADGAPHVEPERDRQMVGQHDGACLLQTAGNFGQRQRAFVWGGGRPYLGKVLANQNGAALERH